DEQNLETMRNIGMTYEDEEKIIAMRDYIYKLSVSKMNTRPRLDESIKMENVVGTPSPYRISSAKSSKASLVEPSVSRVSSDSNLQLLKAEDQARLIPTSLREARMNSEGKAPAKPVSSSHQPELVTSTLSSTIHRKNVPAPIAINAANKNPQDSLTPSFSTPVRERHISLAKRPVESPKAAPATSTNTTTVIGTMEMPIPAVSKPDITINGINGNVGPQIKEIPPRKNLGAFVSSTY
ncbi:5434_t:CDS:2, partial [Racocetra persica]